MKRWTCAASLLLVIAACDDPPTAPLAPGTPKVTVPEAGPMSTQGPVAGPLSVRSPEAGPMSTEWPRTGEGTGEVTTITSAAILPGRTAGARQFEPAGGATAAIVAPAMRLLWQNTSSGDRSIWIMNGPEWEGAYALLPSVSTAWSIVASADFNTDGNTDIVWQNTVTGDRSIWFMNGNTWGGSYALLPNVALAWSIAGAGDFNWDGEPDLVWQNTTTGDRSIWFMNGSTWTGSFALLPNVSPDWRIAAVADFDGSPSLVWQNLTTGQRSIWFMFFGTWYGGYALLPTVSTDWRIVGAADFDGDNKPDLVWQNVTTGQRSIWIMNGSTWDGSYALLPTIATAWSIAGTLAPPAPVFLLDFDFWIDGMYVTQATQTYYGTVPLVAGRAAFLRVFVKAIRANSTAPTVRVRFYQGGILVDTRTLSAGGTSVPTAITEGVLTSSWNYSIPGSMIQDGLTILADVDPTNWFLELFESNNSWPPSGEPMTFDVRTVSTFNVMFVPVLQTPNGLQGDVTDANKGTYMDFSNRVYPLATYDAAVHAAYSYGSALSSGYDITWTTLLNEMVALRLTEGSSRHYYGVIKPAYSFGGSGFGRIGGYGAVGVDLTNPVSGSNTTRRSMTAAHEWGHNFNRNHVDCGGPANPDPEYPYATNSIGQYGYDLSINELLAPASYADLMSYCTPLFVSDYTYKGVLDYRATLAEPAISPAPQHSLLVWGRIGPHGVVLEPAFEIDAPPSLPTRAGPYRVQATDDAGREIFNLSFEGEAIDHAPNERQFVFVVPLSATGAKPATLRLVANGREAILRSTAATSSPSNATAALASVRLSPINGSRSRLEWDAASFPMALVRDPATGQVLSFARGGQVDIALPGRDLDVIFSDGVISVRRLVPITSR